MKSRFIINRLVGTAKINSVSDPTISLSFRYMKKDIAQAVRFHHASYLRPRFDLVMAVVLAALGAYCWRFPSSHWFGVVFVGTSAVFVAIVVAAFLVIPNWAFRHDPKFRDEYSLTFSPEGVQFRTANIDSHLGWSLYTNALVNSHTYLLYWGARKFTVIPSRVFQSPEQQQAFDGLLAEHVPKIVRRV